MANTQLVKVKIYVHLQPNEEMIWIGKPSFGENLTVKYFTIFTMNIAYIIFGIYLVLWKKVFSFDYHNPYAYPYPLFVFIGLAVSIYALIRSIGFLMNQNTMTYGFSNIRVFWARKDFNVIVNELPFSKIAKIDLVGTDLNDKLFSIYFSPTETLDFEGYNYDLDESRPFPSFEKVMNGDIVYEELRKAWNKLRSEN